MIRSTFALHAGVSLAAIMIAAGPAFAQSTLPATDAPAAPVSVADPDVSPEIVVTGSRIRRDPLNQDSPVVVLDQDSLAQTGLSAVADILQRLPSASGGLNSKVN